MLSEQKRGISILTTGVSEGFREGVAFELSLEGRGWRCRQENFRAQAGDRKEPNASGNDDSFRMAEQSGV